MNFASKIYPKQKHKLYKASTTVIQTLLPKKRNS